VFSNDAYYVNDIYYATRTATATNRLDYTDEETGYNSTAVLTYDFKVDVDNAHLDINGDGSWEIGSENFDTKIYAAGLEEPTNIIVQANNRYWTFDDAGGFSVKGTCVTNYTESKSISKTVRKPDQTLPEVLKAGKIALRNVLTGIATKESLLTGRINKDVVLLRVL